MKSKDNTNASAQAAFTLVGNKLYIVITDDPSKSSTKKTRARELNMRMRQRKEAKKSTKKH